MRALPLTLLSAALLASASTLTAQDKKPKEKTPSPDRGMIERTPDVRILMRGAAGWGGAKSMIGVSTSSTGTRDTLGLLVTSVTPNGPAEKAGIVEGNRIAAINGVNLRLAAADAGEEDMQGITARRLTRELGKVEPGTEVELRVYADGQWKTVKVKTISPDSLMPVRFRRADAEDRAVLGFELNSSGSKRDTLGVLIAALKEDGPAEKAGLVEGDRVASVNGTDLRVRHDDAGDDWVSSAMVSRFQRAMRSVKPGDKVELRVWSGGQTKTVQVTAAKSSELYKEQTRRIRIGAGPMIWDSEGEMLLPGDGMGAMIAPVPPVPPVPPMPGFYTPRARVRTFDMNDETDRSDAAAEARAAARADARARTPDRAIMSSAANMVSGTPAIAAVWTADAMTAASAARTATGSSTIRIPGLAIAPVTPDLAEYLGKGSRNGYLVLEAAGQWSALRAGDVLLTVDGECVSEVGVTTASDARDVVVLRKGKKLNLHLSGS